MRFSNLGRDVVSKALQVCVLATTLAVLGACLGMGYNSVKDMTPTGSEFNKDLYAGYVKLSGDEYAEYDYMDSDGFADKARAAAADGDVQPANLADWDIPDEYVDTLTKARARLVAALDAGGRTKVPASAAHAQVMYDCWVQEQEENFQPDDIAACRSAFFGAITAVENALRPAAAAKPAPKPAAAPEPAPEPISTYFVVFFDHNSSTLSEVAKATVREAVAAAKKKGVYKALVNGYADTSGAKAYNLALSERRARAVVKAINEAGGRFVIKLGYFGEDKLAAQTADGVRDGRNRRVEIILQ